MSIVENELAADNGRSSLSFRTSSVTSMERMNEKLLSTNEDTQML